VYIIVVYKKGWLKRNSVESHFLCPNPKCRKIFTEPVWLTDLSKTPPDSYPACPHCSINLNIIPFSNAQKSPPLKSPQAVPSHIKEFKKPVERTQTIQRETSPEKQPVVREVGEPTFAADTSKSLSKPEELPESKPLIQTLEVEDERSSKLVMKPKVQVQEEKKPVPSFRDCSHFFGFVKSLPKNTPIPDECLGCPWIVQCLTHEADKVEAK
jgi:hypothetical protein